MGKKFIPLVLATGREGRESEKPAKYFFEKLQNLEVETQFIDVRDMITPFTVASWMEHEKANNWRKIAKKAHGFIIVTPEYNHGYPGELKILLDYAFEEYESKKVALCSVSSGGFGGARCVENLLPILYAFKMQIIPEKIYIPNVPETFSKPKDELDRDYKEKFEKMVESLIKN